MAAVVSDLSVKDMYRKSTYVSLRYVDRRSHHQRFETGEHFETDDEHFEIVNSYRRELQQQQVPQYNDVVQQQQQVPQYNDVVQQR